MLITDELSDIVGAAFEAEGLAADYGRVQTSDRPDLAQFQCNGALAAAKAAKAAPRLIAENVAARLRENAIFERISVAGPGFLNLDLSDAHLSRTARALAADPKLGGWASPTPRRVLIDYGGPNVAKPMHVGHLRAAIIGNALVRLFRFVGDEVIGDVHLGDWGLQMGQILSELARRHPDWPYFDPTITDGYPAQSPVTLDELEMIYPEAAKACREDPARMEAARKATAELQAGRPGYRALWRAFVDLSIAAVKREYAELGVEFELWKGESDAAPLIPELRADLDRLGLIEESDGALIVRVDEPDDQKDMPPLILFKSDGSVLYGTTDLATILDRKKTIDPNKILYVVDQRQALHFEQVFRVAEKADYFGRADLEHIGFGTMQGPDRKPFKTRAGGVMKLRDLIDMVVDRAKARITEAGFAEGYGVEEAEAIARRVGVAALKFADLSNYRGADYVFDLDRFMAFEGKTGPYLQYAAVRIKSILRKAEDEVDMQAISIASSADRDVALALLGFGEAVRNAYEKRAPNILCEFLFGLAQSFSKFYKAHHILNEPDLALRASRLALAGAVGAQIELTLGLLGVETPERM